MSGLRDAIVTVLVQLHDACTDVARDRGDSADG